MPINLLLVDDHRFVATVLNSLLAEESDISFHWCERAVDAVGRANALRPDVILQDLVMPDIDGFTLVRRFRANPSTATTPVIVLSGSDDDATRAQAVASGASDFMVKLPAKEVLLSALRRHALRDTEAPVDADVTASVHQAAGSTSPDFALAPIDQFITEAESRVRTLRDAAARGDGGSLGSTAHSLRGSSSIMGARRLASLCGEIENGLKDPARPLPSDAFLTTIEGEFARVRVVFATERASLARQASLRAGQ